MHSSSVCSSLGGETACHHHICPTTPAVTLRYSADEAVSRAYATALEEPIRIGSSCDGGDEIVRARLAPSPGAPTSFDSRGDAT